VAISRELPPGAPSLGETPSTRRSVSGTELVRDHFDFVWRLLRRLGLPPDDADDSAQQVFMTATQKLDRISPGNERTYLYGVAVRVAANLRRKAYRRREGADGELSEAVDEGASPDEAAELRAARALLDEILATLPDELRRVLVLAQIEQLEVAEIARAEGIPTGTAASRLRRARAQFGEELARVRARAPFRAT
jgi:RNA polymerase sigma-70 factor (ECF subfamily)